MWRFFLVVTAFIIVASCRPAVRAPKPAGYFRIDTPATHTYQVFDNPEYPYTFEYPTYSKIEKDTSFMELKTDNPYWLNISFPSFNAKIFFIYKTIPTYDSFMKMVQDSYGYTFAHHEKANYIREEEYTSNRGVSVMLYSLGGDAASSYQFTATDTVKHFMRGALYFDVIPNADSLKPANDFLIQDIKHILGSLKFR